MSIEKGNNMRLAKLPAQELFVCEDGQMIVHNRRKQTIFVGRVRGFDLANGVRVIFHWVAKPSKYSPRPKKWIKCRRFLYVIDMEQCTVRRIGEGRLRLSLATTGDTIILSRPGDKNAIVPKGL